MEINTKNNPFRFKKYRVVKSTIELSKDKDIDTEFSLSITPSGVVREKEFELQLDVNVKDKSNAYQVFVSMIGVFEFKDEIENVSDYFKINAPAILFPYLRAYVSSLTSISGVDTVIMPTINTTPLKNELEKNIEYKV